MKRLLDYLIENAWVWAGTGLVLLTLSGSTLNQALWITCLTVLVHFMATMLKKGDPE
jgi:hypothetical protein